MLINKENNQLFNICVRQYCTVIVNNKTRHNNNADES